MDTKTLGSRLSSAEICRRNGWGSGIRLVGDEGYGEEVIEITAVGRNRILARAISRRGWAVPEIESLWSLDSREWAAIGDPLPDFRIQLADALDRVAVLERELAEAKAESAACIKFIQSEIAWADFRGEMLGDTAAEGNFARLSEFVNKTGHGLGLLDELAEARKDSARKDELQARTAELRGTNG